FLSLLLPCIFFFLNTGAAQGGSGSSAQTTIWSADSAKQIDDIAQKVLQATGVPSASVAVVIDNKIAYAHAYGDARVEPKLAASPDMRYSIGSISKQFCATAVLMLAEQGKLSLDDKVAKYVPDLTR